MTEITPKTTPKSTPTSIATSLGTPDPATVTTTPHVTSDLETKDLETKDLETIGRNKRSGLTPDRSWSLPCLPTPHNKFEVHSINERMRHGYSLSEGEYLRARLHEMNSRQYERSCLR